MLSPQKRKFLIEVLGMNAVLNLETTLPAFAKELRAAGVRYKGQGDVHPAEAYAKDLMLRPETPSTAVRELRRRRQPAAIYAADLIQFGAQLVRRG